ncbi:uridylate kinase [Methyloglobulus sp.]|jgi:5-(aminomethyl)-3-furanmethanol phosphate kinase|uniref:amino acid kinase family protein n=1 Tax=Methyloglobulus sp. TaxID=2518622 RepID=UPI0032B76435
MIVIKLGGSLATSGMLQPCLDKIERSYQGRAVVIVPGGGVFADQVRQLQQPWRFDDRTAHLMALLAMQQMALVMNALKPYFAVAASIAECSKQINKKGIAIWSPDVAELDKAGIPSSWEITSDSLSAWLAKTLVADELILVKSVNIEPNFDVLKLVQQQIVDVSFHKFTQQTSFKLNIVNAEEFVS